MTHRQLKTAIALVTFLMVLLMASASALATGTPGAGAAPSISVTASLSGSTVSITGSTVANDQVAIQVNDPNGNHVFVDQVAAGGDGSFSASFSLSATASSGTYTVYATVTTTSGPFSNSATFSVSAAGSVPVTGVTLNKTSDTITAGGFDQLTATITPSNAGNQAVTWSSDNTAVATVGKTGLVSGVAQGTANIKVTTQDGGFTATCAVTVNAAASGSTSLSSGDTNVQVGNTPVQVTVPSDVNGATLTATNTSNGTATLPQVNVQSSTSEGNVDINIPDGTQVTGTGFTGTINLPRVVSNPTLPSGDNASVAIEIGLGSTPLKVFPPIEIVLVGKGGQTAGFIQNGNLVQIPAFTAPYAQPETSADAINALAKISSNDGCFTDGSSDLVIWTEHLTTFVAYTASSSTGGSPGGGGAAAVTVPAPTLTAGSVTAVSAVINLSDTGNVASFNLYENGSTAPVNASPITASNNQASYTVTGLTAATTYTFTANAKDASGNQSGLSAALSVTTAATPTVPPVVPSKAAVTFSDVPAGYWAHDDIYYMADHGYVHGMGGGLFAPDTTVTRAQFVTILANMLGLNGQGSVSFTDVSPSAWYYHGVVAAYNAGLIKGLSTTTFGPDLPVTREQMADILANVLTYKGISVQVNDPQKVLSLFQDAGIIDQWAVAGSAVSVQEGIIHGLPALNGGLLFEPLGSTTRAQATVMLRRLLALL